jgi:hypothetical protein
MDIKNNKEQAKVYLDQLRVAFGDMDPDIIGSDTGQVIAELLGSKNVLNLAGKLVARIDKGAVLKIGHKIGYKFKPWQATKLTTKFARAVPFINIAAVVLEVAMHIREKQKEKEADKQNREFRQDISKMFEQSVGDTKRMMSTQLIKPVNGVINTGLMLLKDKKIEILNFSESNKNLALKIEEKREECMQIYDEIYESI